MLRGGLSCASSVTRGCSHSILRSMNERELGVSFQLDELEALKTPQTTLTTQPPSPLQPVTSTADLPGIWRRTIQSSLPNAPS